MNGKGSKPRPFSISIAEFGKRFDSIFRRKPAAPNPDVMRQRRVGGGGLRRIKNTQNMNAKTLQWLRGKTQTRVFRGWINVGTELPKKAHDDTTIRFGTCKWLDDDSRCVITVRYEKPRKK